MERKIHMQPWALPEAQKNGEVVWEHKPEWRREDMSEIIQESYVDLGWENAWGGVTPDIVKACDAAHHIVLVEKHISFRAVMVTKCKTCLYFYQTDSGD